MGTIGQLLVVLVAAVVAFVLIDRVPDSRLRWVLQLVVAVLGLLWVFRLLTAGAGLPD